MLYTLVITICLLVNGQPVCTQGPIAGSEKLDRATCEQVAQEMTATLDLSDGSKWAAEVKCLVGA